MSRIQFNFQTKVLVPVVGVLVLFFVATMWLLSLRIQTQLRSEAGESLMTAREVFKNSLSIRAQNLEAQINPLCNQPSFMPMFMHVVELKDERTLQDYLAAMLQTVTSDAKAALFTT